MLQNLGLNALNKHVAVPGLNRNDAYEKELLVPPLDEQKRIAAVLDKADALCRQRQETLQLTEKILKSLFIKMFGDLTRDGLRALPFDQLAVPGRGVFSNGPFGSDLLKSELQDTGVPVVYIRDIRNGEFAWKSNVFVTPEKASTLPSCEVRSGDLLIAKVGDPPGVAALYPDDLAPAIITQDVIRVRINTHIAHPVFLQHYLNSDSGRHLIQTITVKGTRSRFSLRDLKNLKVPIPALELQAVFAAAVTRILELRRTSSKSGEVLSHFFLSLQQRAFRGELNLSRLQLEAETEPQAPSTPPEPIAIQGRYTRPGSFIAPPDIEAQMMALEDQLDIGPGDSIPWSEDFFKYRILSQVLKPPFSFSEIWEAVEYDMEEANYENVKAKIFEYIEEGILEQKFDDSRKEIVLSPRA